MVTSSLIQTWSNLDGNEGFQTPTKPSYIHNHSGAQRTVIIENPLVVSGLDTTNTGDADSRFGIDLSSISANAADRFYVDTTKGGTVGLALLDSVTDTTPYNDGNETGVATTALSGSGEGMEVSISGSQSAGTYTVSAFSITDGGNNLYRPGDQISVSHEAGGNTLNLTFTLDTTVLTHYMLATSVDLADAITGIATTTLSGNGSGAVVKVNGDTVLAVDGATPGLYVIDSIDVTTAGSGYQQGDRISFVVGDYTLEYNITNVLHLGQATVNLADGATTVFEAVRFKDNTAASDNGGQFTTYA